MAYIAGSGSRSEAEAQKRRGAALALQQIGELERALEVLSAPGREAFMARFIPVVTKAAEAVAGSQAGTKAAPSVLNKSAGAGGRSFVSREKSAGRRCPNPQCRKKIKAKHGRCPGCGTRNPRPSAKALKAAVAADRRVAVRDAAAARAVVKTVNPVTDPDGHFTRMRYHPDPQWRLFAEDMLRKGLGSNGGTA